MFIRKQLFSVLFFLIFCLISLIISCTPEDETPKPAEDARDKFVATWTCRETCGGQTVTFQVSIEKNASNSTEILIDNFNQLGTSNKAKGIVAGANITIAQQNVGGFAVNGSGSIDTKQTTINLSYNVDDGAQTEVYSAVLTK